MGDLTENFSKREFACRCGCGFDTPSLKLVQLLQRIRNHIGQPITVVSGCRCPKHNSAVGGARNSQHLLGKAADIKVPGLYPEKLGEYLEEHFGARIGGMGIYATFVHIDVREYRVRWRG